MPVSFGPPREFSGLLPDIQPESLPQEGFHQPRDEGGRTPDLAAVVKELHDEVMVLGEIIRRTIPIGVDGDKAKYATPGEFRDIKDAVRKELFAPPIPRGVVTQETLAQVVGALQQQLQEVRDAILAPPENAPAKSGRKQRKEESSEA